MAVRRWRVVWVVSGRRTRRVAMGRSVRVAGRTPAVVVAVVVVATTAVAVVRGTPAVVAPRTRCRQRSMSRTPRAIPRRRMLRHRLPSVWCRGMAAWPSLGPRAQPTAWSGTRSTAARRRIPRRSLARSSRPAQRRTRMRLRSTARRTSTASPRSTPRAGGRSSRHRRRTAQRSRPRRARRRASSASARRIRQASWLPAPSSGSASTSPSR